MVTPFSASDFELLRSWALEITAALLPNVKVRDEASERRWLGQGGFTVNRQTGAWYSHADHRGSYSAVELIKYLGKYGTVDAEKWAVAWLGSHQGCGGCTDVAADDDDAPPASQKDAERVLREAVGIAGTPAEAYLKGRCIEPPYHGGVLFWPNARPGEGAIVFMLKANGRNVGMQVGYLDPYGNKSVVIPQRRRFMLEKAPGGACFEIPGSGNGQAELIIACGVEDALAIHQHGQRPGARVIGLPGDGALRRIRIDKGEAVTVCRDADVDNPAADRAVAEGLDGLLLQNGYAPDWSTMPAPAKVFVTKTGNHGKDANAVLIEKGEDGLAALLHDTEPAQLSLRGSIRWLAKLDRLECDVEVKRAAKVKALNITVGVLRAEIADWRKRSGEDAAEEPEDDSILLDEDIDIGATLHGIVAEMKRYVVAPDELLAAAAAWAAFTHLVHIDRLAVPIAPRLGIQAKSSGCGKTVTLEVLNSLVYNSRASASITAAVVKRLFSVDHPTLLVDEVQRLFKAHENGELISLLNAGHSRWDAFSDSMEPTPDGGWVNRRYSVWGTMALASIGELPEEQQGRAIIINLRRALAKDVPARLRHGTSDELKRRYAELVTWAASLEELPKVKVPEVLQYQPGRVFDNWEPIIQIAELAGGEWPELIRRAIADAVGAERADTWSARILRGVKTAFDTASLHDKKPVDRLSTKRLIGLMIDDEEEEWGSANYGRPINQYFLRHNLRGGLIDPPRAQKWWLPDGLRRDQQHMERGYLRSQFETAWASYLCDDDQPNSTNSSTDSADGENISDPHPGSATSATDNYVNGGNAGGCGREGYVADGPIADSIRHKKSEEISERVADVADVADENGVDKQYSDIEEPLQPGREYKPRKMRAKRVKPNGQDQSLNGAAQGQSRTDVVRSILTAHPDWDIKKVADAMGQSVRNIGVAFRRASQP
jgi:hypothetical protein